MITFSNYKQELIKEQNTAQANVQTVQDQAVQQETHIQQNAPIQQNQNQKQQKPERLKGMIELKNKIDNIKKKVADRKSKINSNVTQGGVDMKKGVGVIIHSKSGEKYDLNFLNFMQTDNSKVPLYSVVTDDENMSKHSKNYLFVDNDTYNNLTLLYKRLAEWKNYILSNPKTSSAAPVKASAAPAPATTSKKAEPDLDLNSITTYSNFVKIFEVEQKQSSISSQKFDTYVLSMFANSAVFGRFNGFKEVSSILGLIKQKYPNLYKKQYKSLLKLRSNILPESKKSESVAKWYLLKWVDKEHEYFRLKAGDRINVGNSIVMKKLDKSFATSPIKIENIEIKQQF